MKPSQSIRITHSCASHRFLILAWFILTVLFLCLPQAEAQESHLRLLYSGNEQGVLEAHGCEEQVGGLDRRHTVIQSLRAEHPNSLNLHVGNILGIPDSNNELVYQVALEALGLMEYDVAVVGPRDLCLPVEVLRMLQVNQPDIPFLCANLSTQDESRFLPYNVLSVTTASEVPVRVAIVGLVSQTHEVEIQADNPGLTINQPSVTLANLREELLQQSDLTIVVFHAAMKEAQVLVSKHPWVTQFIVPQVELAESVEASNVLLAATGDSELLTSPPQGESVGALDLGLDSERCVVTQQNQVTVLSEEIVPSDEMGLLLELVAQVEEETWNVGSNMSLHSALKAPRSAIHLVYFHKRGCDKCARANKVLQSVREKYPELVIDKRNVKENQELLEAMGELYGIPEVRRLTTPTVFIGDEYFLDALDEAGLTAVIERYQATGIASRLPEAETGTDQAQAQIMNRFYSFGALAVAGAGLLDGINPCAFATIIFFVSYLSIAKRNRREMLFAGLAFAGAVFVTYLLLGMGTLKFLEALGSFTTIGKYVYLVAGTATLALAGLSFYDAYQAKQGRIKDIKLQLPDSLKRRIHKVIRERTRTSGVIAGALAIGFAVSALELVCTGQVYLPTLTFVAGIPGMQLHAYWYLLLYNVMFVLPLLVVFGFVYWGTTHVQLDGVLQRHLMGVKVGTGVVLLGLGCWLLVGMI